MTGEIRVMTKSPQMTVFTVGDKTSQSHLWDSSCHISCHICTTMRDILGDFNVTERDSEFAKTAINKGKTALLSRSRKVDLRGVEPLLKWLRIRLRALPCHISCHMCTGRLFIFLHFLLLKSKNFTEKKYKKSEGFLPLRCSIM